MVRFHPPELRRPVDNAGQRAVFLRCLAEAAGHTTTAPAGLRGLGIQGLKIPLLLRSERLQQLFGDLPLDLKILVGGRGVDLLHALLLFRREPDLIVDLRNRQGLRNAHVEGDLLELRQLRQLEQLLDLALEEPRPESRGRPAPARGQNASATCSCRIFHLTNPETYSSL